MRAGGGAGPGPKEGGLRGAGHGHGRAWRCRRHGGECVERRGGCMHAREPLCTWAHVMQRASPRRAGHGMGTGEAGGGMDTSIPYGPAHKAAPLFTKTQFAQFANARALSTHPHACPLRPTHACAHTPRPRRSVARWPEQSSGRRPRQWSWTPGGPAALWGARWVVGSWQFMIP